MHTDAVVRRSVPSLHWALGARSDSLRAEMQNRKELNATQDWWPQVDELVRIWQEVHMAYLKALSLNLDESTRKWHEMSVHFTELRMQDSAVQSSSDEQYHLWVVKFCCLAHCHSSFVRTCWGKRWNTPPSAVWMQQISQTLKCASLKKANSVSVDLLSRLRKSDSMSKLKEPMFAKMGLKASHTGWILR